METLLLALSVVFPLFFMMAVGFGARRLNIVGADLVAPLNRLVFYVLLPVLLFVSIYQTDIAGSFKPSFVFAALGVSVGVFTLLMLALPRIIKERRDIGVMVQGVTRGNSMYFGIPIYTTLMGGDNMAPISILIAIIVPLYNVLSVIALETFRGGKVRISQLILDVLKNPLIIATLLALLLKLCRISLPDMLISTLVTMSKAATPAALILLGASFSFADSKGNGLKTAAVVLGKLVLLPGVALPLGAIMRFDCYEMAALLAVLASPTAIATYSMAKEMQCNDALASQIVVYTSLLSIASLFLWTVLLRSLGLI